MIKMRKNKIFKLIIAVLVIISLILVYNLYDKQKAYAISTQNKYNMAFYELVDYVQNVKIYLAKSLITIDDNHGAETLTHLWREANLAHTYLSMLPLESQELENTEKFLNQVSEYSYALSRKNIDEKDLSEEDLNNLKILYTYSVELSNVLNQLSEDINSGRITWNELQDDGNTLFAQQVSNISQDSFGALEENFHEYAGLIYDGAFSEHLINNEKKGLEGEEINEETAKQKIEEFINKDKIEETTNYGLSENAEIKVYTFAVKAKDDQNINIAISQIGGHIVYMDSDREIATEILSEDEAKEKARQYLEAKGYTNMKDTYYLKQNGILTINFAYEQKYNDQRVIMYADLIKVKVALDNGEVLGIETTGYLNNHYERELATAKLTIDEARNKLNKDIEITNERLAMIPTEWATEIFCYEFHGKIDDIEFLTYINVETGEEEDTLVITDTGNGMLTE
jgi:germination protein YpeB